MTLRALHPDGRREERHARNLVTNLGAQKVIQRALLDRSLGLGAWFLGVYTAGAVVAGTTPSTLATDVTEFTDYTVDGDATLRIETADETVSRDTGAGTVAYACTTDDDFPGLCTGAGTLTGGFLINDGDHTSVNASAVVWCGVAFATPVDVVSGSLVTCHYTFTMDIVP